MSQVKSIGNKISYEIGNNQAYSSEKKFVQKAWIIPRVDQSGTEMLKTLKQRMVTLGISAVQIDSLGLIPLLETAEDDGIITQKQKEEFLEMMKNWHLLTMGIDPKLRELWEPFRSRTSFPIVWTVYLRDLARGMIQDDKLEFKECVTGLCKFMNNTVGGFIKAPDIEDRILVSIESAFT
jgi:hypothetical protein